MEKHYDFKTAEAKAQQLWRQLGIYKYHPPSANPNSNKANSNKPSSNKPIYSIDTPPPTVSGALHIGHIFSYTQAEIIARYKRMNGYSVFYPFGFDDNGLPTERLVEREHGIRGDQMSREDFTALCLSTTQKYEADFRALWDSLGFSCDWDLQYETISQTTQRIAQRSFIDLYNKGIAYRKSAPVLWCPHCQTSIAQADVEQREKNTYFVYMDFSLEKGETIPIATTRPEMLYGCVALFVHPEDDRYNHLAGLQATVPLYNHQVPILTDRSVDPTKGTGAVMCCTFGDTADLAWYETHQLPYRKTLLPDGRMNANIEEIGGLYVTKARLAIIDILQERGLLKEAQAITHSVAIHERCEHGVEILPSPQWYIDLLNYKEELLEAGNCIEWYPAHMKTRYIHWVENLKWDWCISRQRFFGVPFPLWYCKDCGEIHVANAILDGQVELLYPLPINPMASQPIKPCRCGCADFEPERGVMDTWMTSSVTPQINSKWGEEDERTELTLPMGLRSQAHEIIRTWAFYTIAKSHFHFGELPWQQIMICGFVLAKRGEKISKSKDNSSMDPKTLIEIHSADAMRYWTAGNKLGTDTFFDPTELSSAKRLINKLWNAGKFLNTLLEDYHPEKSEDYLSTDYLSGLSEVQNQLMPIDRWILLRSEQVLSQMATALDAFEMGTARQLLDHFFWSDFCDDYLELVKARLYQPENFGESNCLSGQFSLFYSFLNILKAYAIYMPHLTEALYQALFAQRLNEASIHQHQWCGGRASEMASDCELDQQLESNPLFDFGVAIKDVLTHARRYKSEHGLSMKSEMPPLLVTIAKAQRAWWLHTTPDLLACTHAQGISFVEKDTIVLNI